MKQPMDAKLLRVYFSEHDKYEGKPLYEMIGHKIRENGLAGVTILRGIRGSGTHSHLHTAKILRLSEDLPIIAEIVDSPEKIQSFLPIIDAMMSDGIVTIENVQVMRYQTEK